MTLRFTAKTHRYFLDGSPIPGVTTLIGKGLPSPALVYWSAKTVAEWVADNPDGVEAFRATGRGPMVAALKEIPWQKRDEAAIRGTDVHALAEPIPWTGRLSLWTVPADLEAAIREQVTP